MGVEWSTGLGEGAGVRLVAVGLLVATMRKWRLGRERDLEGTFWGCSRPEFCYRDAPEQHFASALAKPSPSIHDFEVVVDHDESTIVGDLQGDLGSMATTTMRPRWH